MYLREPPACAMQSLALGYEGWFPYFDLRCCQAAACTLLSVGEAALPQPMAERPFLLYPNPAFFFPSCIVCDIEHSLFMCIALFPAENLQSNHIIPHWNLRLCPANSNRFGKWLLAWRLGSSSSTLHRVWPASPQHLILGPCAIVFIHWRLGFFQLKVPEKNVMALSATLFSCGRRVEVSLQHLQCSAGMWRHSWVQIPALVGGQRRGSKPDAISHPVCWELSLTRGVSQLFLKKDLGKFYLAYSKTPPGSMLTIQQSHPNTG